MAPQTRSASKEAETISVQDKVPGAGRGIGRRLAASALLEQLGALPGLGMADQATMRGLQVPLARQRGSASTRRQPPPPPPPPAPRLPRRLPPRLTHRLQVCEARLPRAVQPWAEDGADAAGGHGPGEPGGAASALSPGRSRARGGSTNAVCLWCHQPTCAMLHRILSMRSWQESSCDSQHNRCSTKPSTFAAWWQLPFLLVCLDSWLPAVAPPTSCCSALCAAGAGQHVEERGYPGHVGRGQPDAPHLQHGEVGWGRETGAGVGSLLAAWLIRQGHTAWSLQHAVVGACACEPR